MRRFSLHVFPRLIRMKALKQASEASEHQSMATHSQPFGQASDVSTTSDINAHHAFYGQVNSTSMTMQDNIAALSGSVNTLGTGSGESFEEQSRKKVNLVMFLNVDLIFHSSRKLALVRTNECV
ncbi:MAG TPA: hypothetical protein VGO47_10140 [Chlamydiales bacterium]|nr:hypothetical protein [Chlamydiales bacterium]